MLHNHILARKLLIIIGAVIFVLLAVLAAIMWNQLATYEGASTLRVIMLFAFGIIILLSVLFIFIMWRMHHYK